MITVSSIETVPRIRSRFSEPLFIASSRSMFTSETDVSYSMLSAKIVPGTGIQLIENEFNFNFSKVEDSFFPRKNFLPNYDLPGVYTLCDSWSQLLESSAIPESFKLSLGTNDLGALFVATSVATNSPNKTIFAVLGEESANLVDLKKTSLIFGLHNLKVVTVIEYLEIFRLEN